MATQPAPNLARITGAMQRFDDAKLKISRLQACIDASRVPGTKAFVTLEGVAHPVEIPSSTAFIVLTAVLTPVQTEHDALRAALANAVAEVEDV